MANIPLPPLTELEYIMPEVWDSTMIVAARRCETYFFYSYANHLRGGAVSVPLLFGGAFAKGLEAYRKTYFSSGGNPSSAFIAGAEAIILAWGDNPSKFLYPNGDGDKRTLDKCIFALDKYFVQWPIATDPLQPHINTQTGNPTFEFSFAVPLDEPIFPRQDNGQPFILTGRADTLGTLDDLPVIEDDKTTTMMGPKWADQWYTRHQFIAYIWALRKQGYKVRHVVVRGIGIRESEIAFAETHPIHRPDHLLDKFEYDLARTLYEMKHHFAQRNIPRRLGDACFSYFRRCQFWDVCSAKPQHEMTWLRAMERNMWDPLHLSFDLEG
jgi:hypothetical protein